MNKHTQGKWTGGRECINDEQGRLLAEVKFGPDTSIPYEEGHANSHLIAAAPEMLEVLKRLIVFAELEQNASLFRCLATDVLALIKKAEVE